MKEKLEVINNMGISWTIYRMKYEILKRIGLLKIKYRPIVFDDFDLERVLINENVKKNQNKKLPTLNKEKFFNLKENLSKNIDNNMQKKIITQANFILENHFLFFSKHTISFDEVNWHYNILKDKKFPNMKHWSEIEDLSEDYGDIKWVWELSRFSFVYQLSTAYLIEKNEEYTEKFWLMFEKFIKENPPELGVNYKCSQEMSIRIMAWIYGLSVFIDSAKSTSERIEMMYKSIYLHTSHIDKHFNFALKSVKNNHTLTEAAALYTVGTVFPFFDKSSNWKKKGKKYIQSETNWQVYDDGSYIQHSHNYHRLAIQNLTWVVRLGQLNNDTFDEKFLNKIKKSVHFLYQMQNSVDGKVPNYGMNDGAYIHPLTTREYLDYRPVLQAAWLTVTGKRLFRELEVDEIALWLGLDTEKEVEAPKRESSIFKDGGYVVLRNRNQFATIRAATYKHRPAQADMLHVDFWDENYNILGDAGTYSYNTDQEKLLYFNGTSSHNTIMINEKDQMKKASRFIWLNWTKSKILKFNHTDNYSIVEAEHYGYSPVKHRRVVFQEEDFLVIVDDISGIDKRENISLSWLFGVKEVYNKSENKWEIPLPNNTLWNLEIYTGLSNCKAEIFNGSTKPFKGWRSLYYGHKEAYPQLIISAGINKGTRIITILSKQKSHTIPMVQGNKINTFKHELELENIGSKTIIKKVEKVK